MKPRSNPQLALLLLIVGSFALLNRADAQNPFPQPVSVIPVPGARPGQRPSVHLGHQGPSPKPGLALKITGATSLATDASGNIYAGCAGNGRILRIDAVTGNVTNLVEGKKGVVSGDGVPAKSAVLGCSLGLAVDAAGSIYVADALNHRPQDSHWRKRYESPRRLIIACAPRECSRSKRAERYETATRVWIRLP